MDATTFVGIVVAIGCILAGQVLEGGHVGSILQLTAAIIVIGGTCGAVITQFPLQDLHNALRQTKHIFMAERADRAGLAAQLVELARKSRREGLLVLENEASNATDPYLRMALMALVDGTDVVHLRAMLDTSLEQDQQTREPGPRMLEAAGGYAPTIGILGAVLGLIHVMENLSDPTKLGAGIAVAFVATVYGVGSANLLFLPLAQKLRMKMSRELSRKEMIMEGICSIQEGINPQMLEKRLQSFLPPPRSVKPGRADKKQAPPRKAEAPRAPTTGARGARKG